MRLMLFFDLPTITKTDRRNYHLFVKNIKKIGFYMLQESVYVKLAIDSQAVSSTMAKVNEIKPPEGSVIVLTVTEKQFNSINLVVGDNNTDVINNCDRLIEL